MSQTERKDPQFARWVNQNYLRMKNQEVMHNTVLHRRILGIWEQERPRMTAELEAQGLLEKLAFVLQELMFRNEEELLEAGMPPTDARETAEREWLMLEPEEDDSEETAT